MKNKLFGIIPLLLGVLLAVGVMTIFTACPSKEGMEGCHGAQLYLMYTGIAAACISLAALFINKKPVMAALHIANLAAGVVAILIPGTLVRICGAKMMHCQTHMKPYALVMGVLIIIAAVINLYISLRKTKKQ